MTEIEKAIELLESNGYRVLNEMAYDKQKIQDTFFNYLDNIIQNYCLISYVSRTNENVHLKNHWKVELRALLLKLNKMNIRSGSKLKALTEEFNKTEYDINDIVDIIETKFELENIKTDLNVLANDFLKNVSNMIKIISDGTKEEIISFIDKI